MIGNVGSSWIGMYTCANADGDVLMCMDVCMYVLRMFICVDIISYTPQHTTTYLHHTHM